MLVIPAIDLLGGKGVRLQQGKKETAKIYAERPWELVKAWMDAGATRLHVVDLDAALTAGKTNNRDTVRRIIQATNIDVEVGGGLRSLDDCRRLIDAGARLVVLGTAAIKDPEMVQRACAEFPQQVIVAVDARAGKVSVEGWTEDTALDAIEIGARVAQAGAAAVLYTDIGRDGMRTGPNLEATTRLCERISPCSVIASGGIARLEDLDEVRGTGAVAVVVGKAIYEGAFTVEQALKRARGETPIG